MHTKWNFKTTSISFKLHKNPARVPYDCISISYDFLNHYTNVFKIFSTLWKTWISPFSSSSSPSYTYFLFTRATVKSKQDKSIQNMKLCSKYSYPVQWLFKHLIFLCRPKIWTKTASSQAQLIVTPYKHRSTYPQNSLCNKPIALKTT